MNPTLLNIQKTCLAYKTNVITNQIAMLNSAIITRPLYQGELNIVHLHVSPLHDGCGNFLC